MRVVGVLCALAIATLGCGDREKETTEVSPLLKTSGAYPAAREAAVERPSGVMGIVKLNCEHRIVGLNGKGKEVAATVLLQGAGVVVGSNSKTMVVTAKHVVSPNSKTRSVAQIVDGDETVTEFSTVSQASSRIAIGTVGLQPLSVWLSESSDLAFLEISESDLKLLLETFQKDPNAPMDLDPKYYPRPGDELEMWGYPGQHLPQVKKATVSAVQDGFFVVNAALDGGFSGGIAIFKEGGQRVPAGIVIRSSPDVDQSTVLVWGLVKKMVTDIGSARSASAAGLVFVGVPGDGTVDGVPVHIGGMAPESSS